MTNVKPSGETIAEMGRRIKLRRTELGMSQQMLGDLAGVTPQQIQKYEFGLNRVNAPTLGRIADALEVPISYFYQKNSAETKDAEKLIFKSPKYNMRLLQAFAAISPKMQRDFILLIESVAGIKGK